MNKVPLHAFREWNSSALMSWTNQRTEWNAKSIKTSSKHTCWNSCKQIASNEVNHSPNCKLCWSHYLACTVYCHGYKGRIGVSQGCTSSPHTTFPLHTLAKYESQIIMWLIVQERCESRGGRPGLSVLTSLLVSVDVMIYWTVFWNWSQLVPNMSTDIWGH